ncbi:hypothetical protein [Methanopyrus sp.]
MKVEQEVVEALSKYLRRKEVHRSISHSSRHSEQNPLHQSRNTDDIQFAKSAPGVEKTLAAMTEGIIASGSNVAYEGSAVNIVLSDLAFIITYTDDAEGVDWPKPLGTRDVGRMMVVPHRSIMIGTPVLVARWADGIEFGRTIRPTSESANDIDLVEEHDMTKREVEDWTEVVKDFNDCVEDRATLRQNWVMTVAARVLGEDRILAIRDEVRPPRDPDLVDWWFDFTYQLMFEYYREFEASREAPVDSHSARITTAVFTTTVDMGTALAREGWDIDESDVLQAAENSINAAIRLYDQGANREIVRQDSGESPVRVPNPITPTHTTPPTILPYTRNRYELHNNASATQCPP